MSIEFGSKEFFEDHIKRLSDVSPERVVCLLLSSVVRNEKNDEIARITRNAISALADKDDIFGRK
ncbi:hypothetical protein J45TS6_47310 [Paenibacillus sp. J45TS6]|uniref:Uncharacterized protein n=1 Tax=Paenibacillus gallinarum TaxID=2762232 RepID=A0ABR8T6A7_9BACL|nr:MULTISPECIES: hypothetical protein [Paenibacillus]MBD7971271.1 hypothetical protein [Paenibacillus gallinarum]GIP46272.1 hypothetical protein J45TS6_47310 [Paenibacillus sp. J45TS6]